MRTIFAPLCLAALLAGCSSQQLYGVGQGWQQQECIKLPDPQERNRCMASSKRSYDEYQREVNKSKG